MGIAFRRSAGKVRSISCSLRCSAQAAAFDGGASASGGDESSTGSVPAAVRSDCVVNSHNEWDTLEEVIVGSVQGATVPEWHVSGKAVWPERHWDFFKTEVGKPFPKELMEGAAWELDNFAAILEAEGVTVRRPNMREGDFDTPIRTPDFETPGNLYAAMPRDVLTVVGNEVIEAPMAWRSRFFEYRAFRELVKEYFHRGAKWTAAPKPEMCDALYREDWAAAEEGSGGYNSVVTEYEPVFDAAEFTRMGRDIFCQQSQVTNEFGIEWMRRHLGDEYNVHVLDFQDKNAMHIDGTFIPLGPGKILINPYRPCVTGDYKTTFEYKGETKDYSLPEMFKGWEIFVAEEPVLPKTHPLYFTSPWTASANVIVLGQGGRGERPRVVCEASEAPTIKSFEDWGFEVVKVPFRHFLPFGGSFHCATVDIRRNSVLESYF
jgi:glycine amidinotransferase